MSLGLAKTLRERGLLHAVSMTTKPLKTGIITRYDANPNRFASIVTETMSEGLTSITEAIYCTATTPSGLVLVPSLGSSTTAKYGLKAGQGMLNLMEKIKSYGLNNMVGVVSPPSGDSSESSKTSTPSLGKQCSVEEEERDFYGLNSIMTMNNKKGFLNRGQAATAVKAPPRREGSGEKLSPPSRPSSLSISGAITAPSAGMKPKHVTQSTNQLSGLGHVTGGIQHGRQSGIMGRPSIDSGSKGSVGSAPSIISGHVTVSSQSMAAGNSSSTSCVMSSMTSCGGVTKATSDTVTMSTRTGVCDSLLRHLGSTHIGNTAGAAAGLRPHSKSGGQLL